MYFEKFNLRWSDIDANLHLGNSNYLDFCSQTRMGYLKQHNIGIAEFRKFHIGPVVLSENINYFREIMPEQTIYVSLELQGLSEDGTIFSFLHKFYDEKGTHYATVKVIGVWIDTKLRKMTIPPEQFIKAFEKAKEQINPEILTMDHIKNSGFKPENIDGKIFDKI